MIFRTFFEIFKQGDSRGAASGGSDFEKLHFLEKFVTFGDFFVPFKHKSSRGAASGGPKF